MLEIRIQRAKHLTRNRRFKIWRRNKKVLLTRRRMWILRMNLFLILTVMNGLFSSLSSLPPHPPFRRRDDIFYSGNLIDNIYTTGKVQIFWLTDIGRDFFLKFWIFSVFNGFRLLISLLCAAEKIETFNSNDSSA